MSLAVCVISHRLVCTLRTKTLQVTEAHAAWKRKVADQAEPYTYKGKPYLLTMGEGLRFLDDAPWLAGRLLHCKAVQDVLLVEITPDGVPIDDVTSLTCGMVSAPGGTLQPQSGGMLCCRKQLCHHSNSKLSQTCASPVFGAPSNQPVVLDWLTACSGEQGWLQMAKMTSACIWLRCCRWLLHFVVGIHTGRPVSLQSRGATHPHGQEGAGSSRGRAATKHFP